MARQTKAARELDEMLTRIYRVHCQGAINVLDIEDVFNAGRHAFRFRASEEAARNAMIARFAELRVDGVVGR